MKVELFAIIKDRASAGAKAQRMIYDTFVQMGAETERFRTYEEPKAFFGEMGKELPARLSLRQPQTKEPFWSRNGTCSRRLD